MPADLVATAAVHSSVAGFLVAHRTSRFGSFEASVGKSSCQSTASSYSACLSTVVEVKASAREFSSLDL